VICSSKTQNHILGKKGLSIVNSVVIEAHIEVIFKPISFLLVNIANLCDQLKPIATSAMGNDSPSHEFSDCVDSFEVTGFL